MLAYNVRLALLSFRKNPGLTALMVAAIAIGIAACVITMTLYHATSADPIWWKSDRLYAVTMDNWDPNPSPSTPSRPQVPPPQVTFRDAEALAKSWIPLRHAVMRLDQGVVVADSRPPLPAFTRMTSADFFAMFDVPFLYGNGWQAAADAAPAAVMVLSKAENQKLFGGINSVGRTVRWEDHEFRVIGVLDNWNPEPKFYDLNNGAFAPIEDVFIPFGWTEALQQSSRPRQPPVLEDGAREHLRRLSQRRLCVVAVVGRAADPVRPHQDAGLHGQLLGRAARQGPLPKRRVTTASPTSINGSRISESSVTTIGFSWGWLFFSWPSA